MFAKEIVTNIQLTTSVLSYNCSIIFIFQCKLLWSDLRYSTILWIFLYRLMSATGYLLAKMFLCKQNVARQNYPSLHFLYTGKARMSSGNGKGHYSDTLTLANLSFIYQVYAQDAKYSHYCSITAFNKY